MPNPFETSFIPQQPLLKVEGVAKRREPLNIALVLSIVVFVVTALVGGGLYYWKKQVLETVNLKALELEDAEKEFNIEDINHFKHLQVSLETAKRLVDDHAIFSVVFDLVEERTAKNIGLTSLSYASEGKTVDVVLSGQAPSYAALYFQIDVWKQMAPVVNGVELTAFALQDDTGVVDFTAKVMLDPNYIKNAQVIIAQERKQAAAASEASSLPDLSPLQP